MTTHFFRQRRDDIAPALSPRTLGDAIADLGSARAEWRARQDEARDVESFPSRAALERVVSLLAAALYPRRLGYFRGPAVEEGLIEAIRAQPFVASGGRCAIAASACRHPPYCDGV